MSPQSTPNIRLVGDEPLLTIDIVRRGTGSNLPPIEEYAVSYVSPSLSLHSQVSAPAADRLHRALIRTLVRELFGEDGQASLKT